MLGDLDFMPSKTFFETGLLLLNKKEQMMMENQVILQGNQY